jgi:NAD(P)-dependent dehydrogenase (short-subunit alcohol dehydrogenase family)
VSRAIDGAIVNVGSAAATSVAPVGAAYGASKAALETLTRYWATEFGAAGIRVNGVASGPVRNLGTAPLLAAHADAMDRVTARGRIGDPEEIADVVLFLVEDRSSYVNGTGGRPRWRAQLAARLKPSPPSSEATGWPGPRRSPGRLVR